MIVGGLLGIFFVTLLRRVMVEDPDLPFPESTAASEIHKAGQKGLGAAMDLVWALIVGGLVFLAGSAKFFSASRTFVIRVGALGKSAIRLGDKAGSLVLPTGGVATFQAPAISPAYLGVGYIIGPELGAMNFAGGLLAWGLFVPLLMYLLGPQIGAQVADKGARSIWAVQVSCRLEIHRASHRRGRNARRCSDHVVQDAQQPGQGHGPRRQGSPGRVPPPRQPPAAWTVIWTCGWSSAAWAWSSC